MDLYDQWQYLQKTGQWRFTPPTHVVAALRAALDQYREEGGLAARLARYRDNCAALVAGMRALGFETFLPDAVQAPIIVTFHAPPDPAYDFKEFYARVRTRGFILYPGKLTAVDTFRVGCIGAIGADDLRRAVAAIADTLQEMGVRRIAPAMSSLRHLCRA
jgi:2-aminoethylphosphonate-pyruvate transaminase